MPPRLHLVALVAASEMILEQVTDSRCGSISLLREPRRGEVRNNLLAPNARQFKARSDRAGNFIVFLRNYIRARAARSGTRDEDSRLARPPRYFRGRSFAVRGDAAQQRDETLTMRNNNINPACRFSRLPRPVVVVFVVVHCPPSRIRRDLVH